jgi:hypothetical protein
MRVRYPDLRAGHVPLPPASPGYDPSGDATHLIRAGAESPAPNPIPGTQLLDSLEMGHRYVLRVPEAWNGDLVVCGTPATRGEFANDAIFGDFMLARGFAFASSNKGVPYNGVVEPAAVTPDPSLAYPVPFDYEGLRRSGAVIRGGMLWPKRIGVTEWNEDLAKLTIVAKERAREIGGSFPSRTYAVGLSNGGGQVRSLLERYPELVDGGLEWAAVYWSPENSILTYLPKFLAAMPAYVRSGYSNREAFGAIVAAGFPPDRVQADPAHPSLWDDHYSKTPPFYLDLTTFMFARLLDPQSDSWCGSPPNVTQPVTLASDGPTNARGLALPEVRAAYVPSAAAKKKIAEFEHTGKIERPLVGVAGTADILIPPSHNFGPYMDAVRASGCDRNYWQYLVEDGPHVDSYAAFGYGLRPQLPFVWRAFDQLVRIVVDGERPAGAGTMRAVRDPNEIG